MTNEQIEQAAYLFSETLLLSNGNEKAEAMRGFIKGASWRINSVWHDTSEEPNGHRLMFIESVQKCFFLEMYFGTWEEMKKRFAIKRWAYAIDLLPEGKEDCK